MEQKRLSAETWDALWRETTWILSRRGNRLRLSFGGLIWVASLLPYLSVLFLLGALTAEQTEGAFLPLLSLGATFLMTLLLLFVTLPLLAGLFRLAARMEAEEETELSELFWCFTDRRAYARAFACGISLGLPLLCLVAAPCLVTDLLSPFAGDSPARWLLVALLAVVADFLVLFWLLGRFGVPFAILCDGKRTGGRMRRAGVWYACRMLPHLLLSVLTLFILFIADTMPRMLVLYFRLCRGYLTVRSEDNQT